MNPRILDIKLNLIIYFLFRNCYKNEGLKWVEIASLKDARDFPTMTTVGDKIIVAGGNNK